MNPEVVDAQPANAIFHEADRIIFAIGLAPGVNLTFSLTDQDLEQLIEQRRERAQAGRLKLLTGGA